MPLQARTDLASEAHRLWRQSEKSCRELPGVKLREMHMEGLPVTAVEILDSRGVEALEKPVGKYFTLELEKRFDRGSPGFPAAARALSRLIRQCLPDSYERVLVAALGNPDITPDALGPLCASHVIVTRHLKQALPEDFCAFREVSLCRTGVLGTTGMESAAQIHSLCQRFRPDCVIAVDALAGADSSRLCSTIQVCSSGIAPGSGVGNDREALSKESLGIPVVALGMPTVIDASLFSGEETLASYFVTPRSIDTSVRNGGKLIAYGINLALHKGLRLEDVDLLVG